MKIGIIANLDVQYTLKILKRLKSIAARNDMELFAEPAVTAAIGAGNAVTFDEMVKQAKLIIAFGGDGLMLRSARATAESGVPVAGINTGTLGFMTCCSAQDMDGAIARLVGGDYVVEKRKMLSATPFINGKKVAQFHALNDIVVSRGNSGRAFSLDLEINGDAVNTYFCDGLIVSTPTGSTAYSLSAGGPIILPDTPAMVISPICPHSLASRPLVLPDTDSISICLRKASVQALLSVDGQDTAFMAPDDKVEIRLSKLTAKIAFLKGRDQFLALREKLGWRGRSSHQ